MFYVYNGAFLSSLNLLAWYFTDLDFFLFVAGVGIGMTFALFVEYLQWRNFM